MTNDFGTRAVNRHSKTSRNAKRVNQSMKNHPFPSRAPGGPGIEPRWTHGAKVAVGTAYSTSSRVWYTLDAGCVTEVYYPTIDTPQIRDLQFLFTDGETFFHDERRNFTSEIDCVSEAALGFEVTNRENEGRYTVYKTILGDPYQNCLLIHRFVLKQHRNCCPSLRCMSSVRRTSKLAAGITTAKSYRVGIIKFFSHIKEVHGSHSGPPPRSLKRLADMSA